MKRGAILLVLVSLAVAGAAPATAHGAVSCHRINAMGTGVGQDLGGGQVQVTAQVIGGGLLHGTYQSSFQIVGFSFPVASFEGPSVFTVTGGTLTTQVTGTLDVTRSVLGACPGVDSSTDVLRCLYASAACFCDDPTSTWFASRTWACARPTTPLSWRGQPRKAAF